MSSKPLQPSNCTHQNGYEGKLYVMCSFSQFLKKFKNKTKNPVHHAPSQQGGAFSRLLSPGRRPLASFKPPPPGPMSAPHRCLPEDQPKAATLLCPLTLTLQSPCPFWKVSCLFTCLHIGSLVDPGFPRWSVRELRENGDPVLFTAVSPGHRTGLAQSGI